MHDAIRVDTLCWVYGKDQPHVFACRQLARPFPVGLRYTATDPHAVTLDFGLREWLLSRDTLAAATDGRPVDDEVGDIAIARCGSELRIDLDSPNGKASVWLSIHSVRTLLGVAYKLVPAGAEFNEADVDTELRELLDGACDG